jgi:hypothetical protein
MYLKGGVENAWEFTSEFKREKWMKRKQKYGWKGYG